MTDNPLVEAVGRAIEEMIPAWMEDNGVDAPDLATAALRAIEDAGYRIEKVGNPNLKC